MSRISFLLFVCVACGSVSANESPCTFCKSKLDEWNRLESSNLQPEGNEDAVNIRFRDFVDAMLLSSTEEESTGESNSEATALWISHIKHTWAPNSEDEDALSKKKADLTTKVLGVLRAGASHGHLCATIGAKGEPGEGCQKEERLADIISDDSAPPDKLRFRAVSRLQQLARTSSAMKAKSHRALASIGAKCDTCDSGCQYDALMRCLAHMDTEYAKDFETMNANALKEYQKNTRAQNPSWTVKSPESVDALVRSGYNSAKPGLNTGGILTWMTRDQHNTIWKKTSGAKNGCSRHKERGEFREEDYIKKKNLS